VWVVAGNYDGDNLSFPSNMTLPTSKTVSDPTNCDATHQCVYITPAPGANVSIGGGLPFVQYHTPSHLYYQGFSKNFCAGPQTSNWGDTKGFAQDITFAQDYAVQSAGDDCQGIISGPWSYVRYIGGEIDRGCTHGASGGFQVQSNQTGMGGEANSHVYVPDHILFSGVAFVQYNISCSSGDHQDCIHIYAWTNSVVQNSSFNNCWDSSILAEGLDENGYAENDIIQNNWFGPTILAVNNCCLRGDSTPSNETFDNWIIRFNSSVTTWNNKTGNVLHNVEFIGNVGLDDATCEPNGFNGSTNVTYAYNISGGNPCGSTDKGNVTNTQVKFANTSISGLNLHIGSGSIAAGFVPGSQNDGCASIGSDKGGDVRPAPCAAGSEEP